MWWGSVGRSPQKVQVVVTVIFGARSSTPLSKPSNRRPGCPMVQDLSTLCSLRKLIMGSTRPRISCNYQ